MQRQPLVNDLLQWDRDPQQVMRVLWFDHQQDAIALFDIEDWQKSFPVIESLSVVRQQIIVGNVRILETDPYASFRLSKETDIPDSWCELRDRAYRIIEPLVTEYMPHIFDPAQRNQLIKQLATTHQTYPKVIRKWLRTYWCYGQYPNALLPKYHNVGNRGQRKSVSDKKRGRPSHVDVVHNTSSGINITPDIEAKFMLAYRRYLPKRKKPHLRQAYYRMLKELFNEGYELDADGILVPILPPAEQLPTFNQFRDWYPKLMDTQSQKQKRVGDRQFNLQYRTLSGNAMDGIYGPGSQFQIDATIGDIYLMSSRDPQRIIGKPVIYMVMDVFSRMIVGFAVTLEGPSWLGAMTALETMTQDKVALCAQYGVTIQAEDWDCQHLPRTILADRGELLSHFATNMRNGLKIETQYSAPYRADWKGIIERNFRTLNDTIIHWLPGAIYEPRQRGMRDYRLDACLNLQQFSQLIIYSILHHNNENLMTWYRMDSEMQQDGLLPYPADIWHWGLQHRASDLRTHDQISVRAHLLPTAKASVTDRGVYFKGLYYDGTTHSDIQQLQFTAREKFKRQSINVLYDPRRVNVIYPADNLLDGDFVPLYLKEQDQVFEGCTWWEVEDELALLKQQAHLATSRHNRAETQFLARIDHVLDQADAVNSSKEPLSMTDIRANRQSEKTHERHQQAWQLHDDPVVEHEPMTDATSDDDAYVPPASYHQILLDRLREHRDEES